MSEIILVENLHKKYPNGTYALRGVSLKIKKGEMVGLMGPSGSGKSTLLHIIAGLDLPTEGRVWVMGREVSSMKEDERADFRKRHVGFIFQFFYLLEDFTALENVALIGQLAGVPDPVRKAEKLLERLGLSHRLHHRPSELSGGEQQRTAIARALILQPDVLLADEPTGNLGIEEGRKVMELLVDLKEEGMTLLVATHNVDLIPYFDRIVRLRDGRVVEEGG